MPELENAYILETHNVWFKPQAVNLSIDGSHGFRIGINDFRFKGSGSQIKLGTFSVKTLAK